jgi:hypothetical protein
MFSSSTVCIDQVERSSVMYNKFIRANEPLISGGCDQRIVFPVHIYADSFSPQKYPQEIGLKLSCHLGICTIMPQRKIIANHERQYDQNFGDASFYSPSLNFPPPPFSSPLFPYSSIPAVVSSRWPHGELRETIVPITNLGGLESRVLMRKWRLHFLACDFRSYVM